jgi:hypothetical protein
MEGRMLARRLQVAGVVLLAVGLAAHVFGWSWLLWLPELVLEAGAAFVESLRREPLTYGLIAAGLVLIVAARLLRR